MARYSNASGVSLPIAVWLATDEYDGKQPSNPFQISATTLLKSIRQIVLLSRAKPEDEVIDVAGLLKSRIGNAVHDAVERAWKSSRLPHTLRSLGYSDSVIQRVEINPEIPTAGSLPIYIEQRAYKQLGKWTLTGKFDMVIDGSLSDIKTTGTFTYVRGVKDEDYILQGSIYRWLHPTKITSDVMSIDFIFTDWKQNMVGTDNYPPAPAVNKPFTLMPLAETEQWIHNRLQLVEAHELTPEQDLPLCTDSELWRSESVWKYYRSGQVTARSTKNFTNAADAYALKNADGGKGLVVEVKGQPTACLYCPVATQCTQKDAYIASGDLVI